MEPLAECGVASDGGESFGNSSTVVQRLSDRVSDVHNLKKTEKNNNKMLVQGASNPKNLEADYLVTVRYVCCMLYVVWFTVQ